MDYRVFHRKADLDSTAYMEIGPGKYSGAHWQDGFLFVPEDAFGMAEGILVKHLPSYDHFAMNDLPKDTGRKITTEWRDVAGRLSSLSGEQAHTALNLGASYRTRLDAEVVPYKSEIASLLRELADACDKFYEQQDWVCILGM
jgi:hypothetical protein